MYRFEWQCYRRPFRRPLQTHHGTWAMREGLWLKLTDPAGQSAWGEIAPLPWFGSESLQAAIAFCQQLPTTLTAAEILSIPAHLPACQFGFGCAAEALGLVPVAAPLLSAKDLGFCGLLPAGKGAIATWPQLWAQGYRTFKWKIGVAPIEQELRDFETLIQQLPASALLRLDANGGLTASKAQRWLQICDDRRPVGDHRISPATIEYLEQPLPVHQLTTMSELATQFQTPIALDESVASLQQLQQVHTQSWPGIFVIKAAIMGYPHQLRQFCHQHPLDLVFSSVFETEIGRAACLQLAQALTTDQRALGFGVEQWFQD